MAWFVVLLILLALRAQGLPSFLLVCQLCIIRSNKEIGKGSFLSTDPSHSRESLPLPPPPSPAPTPVSRHKQGIKVLPTVDTPSVPAEKTRETRNLPPVPLR